MRSKRFFSFIFAALLTVGMASVNLTAFAATDGSLSAAQNNIVNEGYSSSSVTSSEEMPADGYASLENEDIMLSPAASSDSAAYESSGITADETEFSWDRSSESDIVINTDSSAKVFAVRCGTVIGSSLTNKSLNIDNGRITIGSAFLSKLKNGQNDLVIIIGVSKLSITVNVTGDDTSEEGVSAQTDFTWDRNDLIGISVKTDSASRNVTIMKDDEVFATSKNMGVYVIKGRVGITAKVLKKLDDGENDLTLVFEDETVDIKVTVTDNKRDDEDSELIADETYFDWEKGSEDDIIIQTNSLSKSFSVKKGKLVIGTSRTNKSLTIDEGQIVLGAAYLNNLRKGENRLSLVLKEGSIDIVINITDSSSGALDGEITAEKTYYVWDRSDYTGIAVKSNSKSRKVTVTKDGEKLFSNRSVGVYLTFGRVGITSKYLDMLDNGENDIVLEFSDGKLPITVNVTDRKNAPETVKVLSADKTDFTWERGSSEGITVNTNSDSQSVAVRKSGRLLLDTEDNSISIKNGAVTLAPAYLETLSSGKNKLTIILDDGKIDISVNVVSTQTIPAAEEEEEDENKPTTSSGSFWSGKTDITGFVPDTGSAMLAAETLAIASAAASVSVFVSMMKKKNKKKK